MAGILEQAISNHSIILYCQLVLSLSDKTVVAHEVLVRFINGDDLLAASVVTPIAERLGLMPQIDRLILESLASTNREKIFSGRLCVNLSMLSIQENGFVKWLDSFLTPQRELTSNIVVFFVSWIRILTISPISNRLFSLPNLVLMQLKVIF
ncbi:MAG: EAL domain-containing protein (putative c-di-GMP-specific phosphodiesterase class I) [Porticoccus sp.]|jgi:EAL domain-containing protein (putative c-di-GMP-specific phosphodiesterase class I)